MKPPDCPHHCQLDLCNQLLSSFSDSVALVQSFKGRWNAVAAKLSRLRSNLTDLSDHANHPLSVDLLRSLADTLSMGLTLSLHCRAPDPPTGKLQTQSELATVSAALDQHLADADLLLKSGVLLERRQVSSATVVDHDAASPSASSKREVVRAECRNLVTRLQIGSIEQRTAAMDLMIDLMEDDKNVLTAVAQGVVPVLVRILESSGSAGAKEKAVVAIARVSAVESCRCVLVGEGLLLLNHLSRLLESGSGLAKEKACIALQTLTLTKENAMAVGSGGGVSSLLEICRAGTPMAQAAAAGVLKNLAAIDEIRRGLVEENGVVTLTRLCTSGTVPAQENVVACVRNLATAEDRDLKIMVFREFGGDTLGSYWDSQGRDLEPAVGLFRRLASDKYIAEQLISSGFLHRVVSALGDSSSATRTEAARAVIEVSAVAKVKKDIIESDCVAQLVRMLRAKGAEEKEAAVEALAALVVTTENRRILKKEERGIDDLVQLLSPLVLDVEKKYPVSVLLSLSQSRQCRRRMVEAGAAGFLKRLVDLEVDGAKRLLDSLEKGGLLGFLFTRT